MQQDGHVVPVAKLSESELRYSRRILTSAFPLSRNGLVMLDMAILDALFARLRTPAQEAAKRCSCSDRPFCQSVRARGIALKARPQLSDTKFKMIGNSVLKNDLNTKHDVEPRVKCVGER